MIKLLSLALSLSAWAFQADYPSLILPPGLISNHDYVAAFKSPTKDERPAKTQALRQRQLKSRYLFSTKWERDSFQQLFKLSAPSFDQLQKLQNDPSLLWVYPVFVYQRPAQGLIETEWKGFDHLKHLEMPKVWDITEGDPRFTIAVTDDGLDTAHPAMKNQVWTNLREEENGLDDDENGFIDDFIGWDFVQNDNNLSPRNKTHGTSVAGLINAKSPTRGVMGMAPGLKVMPLRLYGYKSEWTALIVAQTYYYAVQNGAKIITTSYGIDNFHNDPIYLSALDYVHDNGALLVNSGGNNNYKNPRRTRIQRVILVGGTNQSDRRMKISNYGYGIDLSAPGKDLPLIKTKKRYGSGTGTSFAAPLVAATLGLVWSQHPNWKAPQVISQVLGTSQILAWDKSQTQLGSGRVAPLQALTQEARPPKIEEARFERQKGKLFIEVYTRSLFQEHQLLSHISLTSPQGEAIPLKLAQRYGWGTNILKLEVPMLPAGEYKFSIKKELKDYFGRGLKEDFIFSFSPPF